jgi:hypothetical protein
VGVAAGVALLLFPVELIVDTRAPVQAITQVTNRASAIKLLSHDFCFIGGLPLSLALLENQLVVRKADD